MKLSAAGHMRMEARLVERDARKLLAYTSLSEARTQEYQERAHEGLLLFETAFSMDSDASAMRGEAMESIDSGMRTLKQLDVKFHVS